MKPSYIIAAGLIAYAFLSTSGGPPQDQDGGWEPTADLRRATDGVRQSLAGDSSPQDARRLANFYAQFATVVEDDKGVIQTTQQIREGHVNAGRLAFPEMRGRYPKLAFELDDIFAAEIGLENTALTPAKRKEVVELFRAISWSLEQ